MKRPDVDRWMVGLLGLAALLALALGLELHSTRQLYDANHWVAHTHEVMTGLERVLSLVKDAESGQRGYLITGEARYLAPYEAAIAAIDEQVARVEQLTADNPRQQARFPELRQRLSARLQLLRETVGLHQNGDVEGARQIFLTDRGQNEMDALRVLVGDMIQHEQELLRERSRLSAQSFRTAVINGILAGVGAIVGVTGFTLLLRRHLSAREAAARVIAEQGERLRTTLASIGDAVITTDVQGRVTNLNHVAETLTGWTNAAAIGQSLDVVFQIVNETTRQPVENPATRALREGLIVGLANHTILIAKDGSERSIDDSAAPIRCKEGELVGCVLIFRDISTQRHAARRIAQSEARKSAMFQAALDCVISIDHEGRIIEFNPSAEKTFGYPRDEVLGQELAELIIPHAFREAHRRGLARYLATRTSNILDQRLELTALRRDGSEFPVELAVTRILADGPPTFTAYLRDITDRRQAEAALQTSEARYRAIGEAIDFGVWMCDAQGRNTYASESFLRLVGLTQEECSGDGWGRVLHPDEAEQTIAAWKECVRTGGVWDREHQFKGTDGQWHHVLARGIPVRDDTGHIVGWAGINLDIDRLKYSEAALREADRRKDEFLATLAHELRNPLAPVRNAVQVLHLKGPDTPELLWARDVIDRQMQGMTRLIDDLMDVSRISRNKLELRRERVELATVVQGAIETSRPLIEAQSHALEVTLPSEPIFLNADLHRLAQVFLNLLNNAAKYTERGGRIKLHAERQGSDVVVSVKDNGIGISPTHLPKLFTMFLQVDGSHERTQGGLGIGLSLVKRLVEMHGGSIDAKSDGPGKGSEFVVRLPVLIEHHTAPTVTAPQSGMSLTSKHRILVVDDNVDAASSLGMMLKFMGNIIRTAHDGEEALRAAEEFRPHVVLLDIGLPKLSGYEVARRIREHEWGTNLLLIAVTGWGQEDDRRKSAEAGFDQHLVKPVNPHSLMTLLAELATMKGPME